MKASVFEIPYGDPGIEQTLRAMQRLATDATADPEMIGWVHDVIRWVPARDTDAEAHAILNAVRSSIRYTSDPVKKELVKTPHVILQEIKLKGKALEDCDGYVTFLIAALEIVGIEAQPVVVSEMGGDFGHVLVRYMSPRQGWVTLDAITRHSPGWFPGHVKRVGVFSDGAVKDIAMGSVQGPPPRQRVLRGYRSHTAATLKPAPRAAWPTMKGLGCGDCGCAGSCKNAAPANPLAKASAAIEPYINLVWLLWAAPALLALVSLSKKRRSP